MAVAHRLNQYISALNEKNNFDLAWEWSGVGDEPEIRIYEKAEGHDLTYGTEGNIFEQIQDALPEWGLVDVPQKE